MNKISNRKRALGIKIIKRLRDNGFDAVFAGGCVRDELLGQIPNDFDIATSAKPEDVLKLFDNTIAVGKQFGVIIVILDNIPFEVATYRHDGPYSDGRHPDSVTFPVARQLDVKRRDFTVNGLLKDPIKNEIFDYVSGIKDILSHRIRAIGNPVKRFQEDNLRILRAIRFAAKLNYSIELDTYKAIKTMAPKINTVSKERIKEELEKILISPRPSLGVKLLFETGLLKELLPEVYELKNIQQPREYHPEGDALTHTILVLSYLPVNPSPALAWATLLHDIGKAPTAKKRNGQWTFYYHENIGAEIFDNIAKRLKFSNELKDRTKILIKNHLRLVHIEEMKDSKFKRLAREEWFEDLLHLTRADLLGSIGDLSIYHISKKRYENLQKTHLSPPKLINGNDLKKMGIPPGPIYKKILTAIEDSQLEGEVKTRKQALMLAHKIWENYKD